jgi:hypothetical protein
LDVEGRLADAGLGEELSRTLEASLPEVERQDRGRPVVEILGERGTFVQGLTHADDLGALTGEQQSGGHWLEGGKKNERVNDGEKPGGMLARGHGGMGWPPGKF